MKILIVSSIPAVPSWGTGMVFYRHFCQRDDFTIRVITDDEFIRTYKVPYSYKIVNKGRLWTRISKTRFYKLPHTWNKLVGCLGIHRDVLQYARDFEPDAVLTMAGTWTWMSILAEKLAKKLDVPLIGCFYDWWYYNVIYHPAAEKWIDKRFRKFYQACNLAICISEGMRTALGAHKNSVISYPMGPVLKKNLDVLRNTGQPFTLAYTGNLGEWYGTMLESLVVALKGTGIQIKIYGNNPSWSKEFDAYVRKENIYSGHIAIEELQKQMQFVDGLLLLMGFDEACALIETTSFKSKFIDYISYQKPIMLWGPEYCSAVTAAKEFRSAEICTSPTAQDMAKTVLKVKEDAALQQELISNARVMYQDRFHPDKVHEKFKSSIKALIAQSSSELV